jgi:hypothetical protein
MSLTLLAHTGALIVVLFGRASEAVDALILDAVLSGARRIRARRPGRLIFSIWYWTIDPPGVDEISRKDERWDFLFPQRGSALPKYDSWSPGYADYLFVAFTTSFAFSPTDTLPLTRRAKMLMLLQAAISIVTLIGIAGGAINTLAGSK